MSYFDSLPLLDLSRWGFLLNTDIFKPKGHDVKSKKLTNLHWSLRFDANKAVFRRRLSSMNHGLQTFTEAPNFLDVMRTVDAKDFNVVGGGRDCAIRYKRSALSLINHDTTVLYPHPFGWNKQIRNVSALVANFDEVTVAVLHMPAHTGRGKEWLEHDEQAATCSAAYRDVLTKLPDFAADLKRRGKPVRFAGDWNKPLAPGYWRDRLERALDMRMTTHDGVCGDFVDRMKGSRAHSLLPSIGYDHDPYAITYDYK